VSRIPEEERFDVTCPACHGKHTLVINFETSTVTSAVRDRRPTNLWYTCPRIADKEIRVPVSFTPQPEHDRMRAQVSYIIDTTENPVPPALGPESQTLIEFGKSVLLNSISVLKDFIVFMVPLTTGLITAYIALLQFMGIQAITDISAPFKSNLVIPPVLMFVSLVAFIFASFPIPRQIAVGNIDSIKDYRNKTFWWKYTGSAVGGIFFIIGVITMILIIVPIMSNQGQENAEFKLYTNPAFNYTIQYPSYWNVTVLNNSQSVIFKVPGEPNNPELKVQVEKLVPGLRLDQYIKKRISILDGGLSSFITIDKQQAYTLQWNHTTNSGIEVLMIKGDKGYLLDYEADTTEYVVYYPTAQKMIQSFKFGD
jgi:hypothetical protein